MPIISTGKSKRPYDVIVVGSGAAGGQAAYTLTMEGARVLMIEAGRSYDGASETPMFQTDAQAPLRGTATPDKQRGFYDGSVNAGWDLPGEPYTNAPDSAEDFAWWRVRMMGGRTHSWGRNALRNGPYDFQPRSRDGLGFDWPFTYDEIAPYYDRVERLIGVYGTNEGLENTPNSSSGILQPPPAARAGERLAQQRARSLGIPVVPIHRAVLTERQNADRLPRLIHPGNPKAQRLLAANMRRRAACFWATPCSRGCSIGATYQSTVVHIPPALATGNLDILPEAMAHRVTVDHNGRATGVKFIDKSTGEEGQVTARAVVLAASSVETIRILLNSRSARHPDGLANSSGLVGRYVMETARTALTGQIPLLENLTPHPEDGAGGSHVYIPWWLYREQLAGKLDFPRGYHIEFITGRRMPSMASAMQSAGDDPAVFGQALKADARRYYGSFVRFSGRGEMIPNADCYCTLDPTKKDRWGIPVIQFHWRWNEPEIRQARHMRQTFTELIEAMGGKLTSDHVADKVDQPGRTIHEVGGAMMGLNQNTSVSDRWGHTWDVPNLVLADGSTFVSNADKNPTLTIMALAWRACDQLLERMRKGDV